MKCSQKCCVVLILAVAIGAVVLRLPRLKQRPMHCDEATGAKKFGQLLEEGFYRYDRCEHHGPTLNYFTLIPARLSGIQKYAELSEFTLRIVPVFFAVCLVLLLWLLVDGLGWPAVLVASVLTAISSAFVFYSRYYIHEMLLVCFTFGMIASAYRYTQSRNIKWALLTGVFLGLCHATKETCIIAFGSMFLALLLMLLTQRREYAFVSNNLRIVKPLHVFIAIAAAAVVSALFYSSFFTNPNGILDSLLAYKSYFNRAGQNQLHIHKWYYYLKMLIYFPDKTGTGLIWNEAVIVFLAVAGFIVAMTRKPLATINPHLLRFIAFYTATMTVAYSAIPYKTPWCLLGFLHGMILLAGIGAVVVIQLSPNIFARVLISILLIATLAQLAWQAYLGSYKYYADPANPYVYAHTSTDVITIAQRVEEIARVHPDRLKMHVQVICPEDDYWPLPWYLRAFANVGWWSKVDDDVPAAPVIIASPSVKPALVRKLYELPAPGKRNLYVPLFDRYMELRPQVELLGFVTKDLWDRFQEKK